MSMTVFASYLSKLAIHFAIVHSNALKHFFIDKGIGQILVLLGADPNPLCPLSQQHR